MTMKFVLRLDSQQKQGLWAHLAPENSVREQAAFLFCSSETVGDTTSFSVVDSAFLESGDFVAQDADFFELTDATRLDLIKRSHTLGTSLVEWHSHLGRWPAAFSFTDRLGLRETVKHMWWRLKCRPYLAFVLASNSFDALVWADDPVVPAPLEGIQVDTTLLRPTNASLRGWDNV